MLILTQRNPRNLLKRRRLQTPQMKKNHPTMTVILRNQNRNMFQKQQNEELLRVEVPHQLKKQRWSKSLLQKRRHLQNPRPKSLHQQKKKPAAKKSTPKKKPADSDSEDEESEPEYVPKPTKRGTPSKAAAKSTPAKSTPKKKPAAKSNKETKSKKK